MAAPKVKVIYNDGREVVVKVTPRAQFRTEERFGGMSTQVVRRASLYASWCSMNQAGMEKDDFETWLEKIDDVEDYPTRTAPCRECDKVGGCAFDDDGLPLWHYPPEDLNDEPEGPTTPAPSPAGS